MTPIINPWVAYWIQVLSDLGVTMSILSVLLIAACTLSLIFVDSIINECVEYKQKEKAWKIYWKLLKSTIAIIVISITLSIAIPSKETMLTMLVLKNVTSNNMQLVGDTVEDVVDTTIDKIKLLMEEKTGD